MDRSTNASDALERGLRFEQSGVVTRALETYRQALEASETPAQLADAKLRIARVLRSMSQWDDSLAESRDAVRIASEAELDDLAAEAMNVEIGVYILRGDFSAAEALAADALDLAESPRVRGIALGNLATVAARLGDFDRADRLYASAMEAYQEANYPLGAAITLNNRAQAALDRGDAQRALRYGADAAAAAQSLGALTTLLIAVQHEASALIALREFDQAEALLTEALGHFTTARDPIRQAECLESMGQVNERRTPPDLPMAARFYERARTLAHGAGERVLLERVTRKLELIPRQQRTNE